MTTVEAGLFSINNASGIRVGNLSVDYDPLPMTQGRVTAVQSPTQYTLELDPGFPSLMLPHFLGTIDGGWGGKTGAAWIILKDKAQPTRHKLGTLNLIRCDPGPLPFRCALASHLSPFLRLHFSMTCPLFRKLGLSSAFGA